MKHDSCLIAHHKTTQQFKTGSEGKNIFTYYFRGLLSGQNIISRGGICPDTHTHTLSNICISTKKAS